MVFILVRGGCLGVICLISRVICECVPAYSSAVCDNEMLHVAKRHLGGEQGCFSLGSCFTECTFSSFCLETEKHDDRSSSKRYTVYHYRKHPCFLFGESPCAIGMKNSIYTNTVYLIQKLTWCSPWKQSPALRSTTTTTRKSKIMVTQEWLCASADLFIFLFKFLM